MAPWLTSVVERLAGRKLTVTSAQAPAAAEAAPPQPEPSEANGGSDARAEAMSSPAVQALLDVFPAEIRDVEEM